MDPFALPGIVVIVAVTIAALTDLRSRRIYNRLTLPLILSGLAFHLASHGMSGLILSGLGLLVASLPLLPAYFAGGMGGGDIKLMGGIGAWLGPLIALQILLAAALAAGIYALVLVVIRRRYRETWVNLRAFIGGSRLPLQVTEAAEHHRRDVIPFGAMVAAGLFFLIAWRGLGH